MYNKSKKLEHGASAELSFTITCISPIIVMLVQNFLADHNQNIIPFATRRLSNGNLQ